MAQLPFCVVPGPITARTVTVARSYRARGSAAGFFAPRDVIEVICIHAVGQYVNCKAVAEGFSGFPVFESMQKVGKSLGFIRLRNLGDEPEA